MYTHYALCLCGFIASILERSVSCFLLALAATFACLVGVGCSSAPNSARARAFSNLYVLLHFQSSELVSAHCCLPYTRLRICFVLFSLALRPEFTTTALGGGVHRPGQSAPEPLLVLFCFVLFRKPTTGKQCVIHSLSLSPAHHSALVTCVYCRWLCQVLVSSHFSSSSSSNSGVGGAYFRQCSQRLSSTPTCAIVAAAAD